MTQRTFLSLAALALAALALLVAAVALGAALAPALNPAPLAVAVRSVEASAAGTRIELSVTNLGRGPLRLGLADVRIVDDRGNEYRADGDPVEVAPGAAQAVELTTPIVAGARAAQVIVAPAGAEVVVVELSERGRP